MRNPLCYDILCDIKTGQEMLRGAAGKKRWNIMARTIQYSFPSKADGLVISCLALVPELGRDEKYRGIIQIVHGMSEYKERYLPFMNIWRNIYM